jgi:hypothetical protein
MTIQNFIYPKPDNWVTFETFCLKLFGVQLKLPHLEKFARSGHRQSGVDLVSIASGRIVGIQCKVKNTGAGLTQEGVDEAIQAAMEFTPSLNDFIIATTSDRNPALQKHALRVTRDHRAEGLFPVTIYSWQDIEDVLKLNSDLAAELYPAPSMSVVVQRRGGKREETPQRSTDIASPIEEVAHNLKLLVADLQVATTLYFDAHDVYQMVLGIDAFVHGQSFLMRDFNSRETLARCIAAAGWYSTIRVLPMHQVELNYALVTQFAQPDPDPHLMKNKIDRFLESAGIPRPSSFDSLSRERWAEFIRERVGDAERLFKCTYCVRSGPPRSRFLDLTRRGILAFDGAPSVISELLNRVEFTALSAVFNEIRPEKTINNFTDASAVTFLIHELERFDRGERSTVPLFFASSPLFLRAAEQSRTVHQLYHKSSEIKSPIFRDSSYLFLRAIFLSPEAFGSSRELEGFRASLQAAVQLVQKNKREGHSIDYNQLEGILGDIQSYKFFENVWLPTMADQETTWVDLTTQIEQLEDKAFQDEVRRAVEEALQQLGASVQQYEQASDLWKQLERRAEFLRERNEPAWRYQLLSLGFSEPLRSEALHQLLDLSQKRHSFSIGTLVSRCLAEGESRYLTSSVAVLWVMGAYKEILSIEALLEENLDPSWLIIKAACLLHTGRHSAALKALNSLEQLVFSDVDKVRIMLGLAVLCYQQFALSGGRHAQWSFKSKLSSDDLALLDRSADYSWHVFSERGESEEGLFALAQCLTARLELSEVDGEKTSHMFSHLSLCRDRTHRLWLPQYNIVIARYYHRAAFNWYEQNSDERYNKKDYRMLLLCAMEALEESRSFSRDENITSYYSYLQSILNADGFVYPES